LFILFFELVLWSNLQDERYEVFTAVKIQVKVVWIVTPCSIMVGYKCFGGPCCLHFRV